MPVVILPYKRRGRLDFLRGDLLRDKHSGMVVMVTKRSEDIQQFEGVIIHSPEGSQGKVGTFYKHFFKKHFTCFYGELTFYTQPPSLLGDC